VFAVFPQDGRTALGADHGVVGVFHHQHAIGSAIPPCETTNNAKVMAPLPAGADLTTGAGSDSPARLDLQFGNSLVERKGSLKLQIESEVFANLEVRVRLC
jgi:hypothetical protein